MPTIFLSPYKSDLGDGEVLTRCGKPFAQSQNAALLHSWPYDYGDDPSFFCRKKYLAALTWGVCRPDVRSQLRPGDVVVFFSFTTEDSLVTYRFSAVATVEQKILHSAIFSESKFKTYRRYRNLLIKPSNGNLSEWVHCEPALSPKDGHTDWLNRVVIYRKYSKTALSEQCRKDRVILGQMLDGKPLVFADNYVLFSTKLHETFVVARPPVIAYSQPRQAEAWRRDPLSKGIWTRTFGQLRKHKPDCVRTLRLERKTQQPHSPPARWAVDECCVTEWRIQFMKFLSGHDLKRF